MVPNTTEMLCFGFLVMKESGRQESSTYYLMSTGRQWKHTSTRGLAAYREGGVTKEPQEAQSVKATYTSISSLEIQDMICPCPCLQRQCFPLMAISGLQLVQLLPLPSTNFRKLYNPLPIYTCFFSCIYLTQ